MAKYAMLAMTDEEVKGEGKESREVTNEKGVHKGEFFPPYTEGRLFPSVLLCFFFCFSPFVFYFLFFSLRRRLSFMF